MSTYIASFCLRPDLYSKANEAPSPNRMACSDGEIVRCFVLRGEGNARNFAYAALEGGKKWLLADEHQSYGQSE